MLSFTEIREKQFKTGLGYDKKDVEQFLNDLSSEFESIQQENTNLKNKLNEANESLAYYKSIEKTLQKALILAEKTSQDTRATALREADAIELDAKTKANQLLQEAKRQLELYEHKILNLMQQYDVYKIHFENLLHAQIELLNSKSFSVNTEEFSYRSNPEELSGQTEAAVASETQTSSFVNTSEDSNSYFLKPEEIDQITFDFLQEANEEKSYQTEDGFEFFTIKDE